jgi:hypothetical protein
MGDFDRKQDKSAERDQSKQVIMVIVLGVVLIGVVGYHFMKKGPQAAIAAAPGAGGQIPMPMGEETAEQAKDALRQDPTAALLRETAAVDNTLNTVPRNPFLMSEGWRSSLVLQVEPVITPTVTPTVVTPRTTPVRVIPSPKAENFKLGSTLRQGNGYLAIINGRIVSAGAVVNDARVIDIQEGKVVLQHANYPDGPQIELTMEPKLK